MIFFSKLTLLSVIKRPCLITLTCLLGAVVYAPVGVAAYQLYFINNTERTIQYQAFLKQRVSGCATLSHQAYQAFAGIAKPYEKVPLFRINYQIGLKRGQQYCFATHLKSGSAETGLQLTTSIRGETIGSTLIAAEVTVPPQQVSGEGMRVTGREEKSLPIFSAPPHPYPHHVVLQDTEPFSLWGQANCRFYGAAIRYPFSLTPQRVNEVDYTLEVPQARLIRSEQADNVLTIGTYNVQLWPAYAAVSKMRMNQASQRAVLIPTYLTGYDIVVVEELMDRDDRDQFSHAMAADYPYQYGPLTTGVLLSGGTMLYSHWPILTRTAEVFRDCYGVDCQAAKGVLAVTIQKGSQRYHLFGMHTQAIEADQPAYFAARDRQLAQVKAFMAKQAILPQERVLIAGDLNVDFQACFTQGHCEEYNQTIQSLLNIKGILWRNIRAIPYGEDSSKNLMNTDTVKAMDDYIGPARGYAPPSTQLLHLRIIRGTGHAVMYDGGSQIKSAPFGELDLSDHFMLESQVTFPQ